MNTRSIDCRRVADYNGMEREGDFYFHERDGRKHITIWYPGLAGEDRHWCDLPLQAGAAPAGPVWGWDGNEEKPTLNPSIHVIGHWHGYLEAGRLRSC